MIPGRPPARTWFSLPLFFFVAALPASIRAEPPAAAPLAFSSSAEGNIFTATQGVVTLTLPASVPVKVGAVTAYDENGRVLFTLPIPAKASTSWPVTLPGKSFYKLDASVTFADGSAREGTATAAVVGPVPADDLRLQSRLGLWTVQGDPALVLAAGARWNRRMTTIKDLPETLLDPATAASVTLKPLSPPGSFTQVGVFSFGLPYWLMEPQPPKKGFGHPFIRPKSYAALTDLVAAYVKKQGIDFPPYLEIYNEPEWQWKGTNEDLVKTLSAIADGVKKGNPAIQVLGPGFSSIRIKDPARLDLVTAEKLGLFNHLDGLVVHAYVDGTPPEGEFIQRVLDLKKFLADIGRPDFPIHLTEFGWTSAAGTWQKPVDELTQARYVARSLALLVAVGVQNATYFCLEFKAAPNPGERGFSLVHADSTPKPAYAAYANVARWLAGVRGLGTWLHLTPTTNLILYSRTDDTTVAVGWDTTGDRPVNLPLKTDRREDMMGRPLPDSGSLTLSPSPVFLGFAKGESPAIKMLPTLSVMRGGLPAKLDASGNWIAPAPLQIHEANHTLVVPPDAPNGDYLLLARGDSGWLGQPVRVIPPLEVAPPVLEWPADHPGPDLRTTLTSHATETVDAQFDVALKGLRTQFLDPVAVKPGEQHPLVVSLPGLVPGVRYKGALTADSRRSGQRDVIALPLDLTLLAAPRVASDAAPDWGKIQGIDFTHWEKPAPSKSVPSSDADCSATLQSAYGERGLYLRIVVRDAEHIQTRSPEDMWNQDSIQIGLDPDFQKTWEANDLFGLKGHRVFEYGVGWNGDPASAPMTWRWVSYLPDLPVGVSEPRIQLSVTRKDNLTTYDICFPWVVMGLKQAPAPGSAVGLALVVNDIAPDKKTRREIHLFAGVSGDKDPEKFGPLWLR